MTPAQHLLAWLTPERRPLINTAALDRVAKRQVGTLSYLLKGRRYFTMERSGVQAYYPALQLLGYQPPPDASVATPPARASPCSLRDWLTPDRRRLLNLTQLDLASGRPAGALSRYLHGERHMTFKIVGINSYYRALQLFGFVPPEPEPKTDKILQHK